MLLIGYVFSYRGGVDSEGRPVMVVVGAHFLLRCLDLERFILYVVKVVILSGRLCGFIHINCTIHNLFYFKFFMHDLEVNSYSAHHISGV